jgi:cysteine desulfurase
MKRSINLDFNSTSPLSPTVWAAMEACVKEQYLNPASPHHEGRRARIRLEQARERIIEQLGGNTKNAASDRFIFTSGGTEANNLALRGLAGKIPGRVIVSAVEHPSVSESADFLATQGFEIVRLAVDRQGIVDPRELEPLINDQTRVVSVMLGNNETGAIQPVAQMAAICAARNIPLHTDAVQAVGKVPVNFRELGVAALSFTAHKLHGPRGIGGLLLGTGWELQPIVFGGAQQLGSRPGTESVLLAVGLQTALDEALVDLAERGERLQRLRNLLQTTLQSNLSECVVHSDQADRLPHTLNVSFPGLDRQALLMALDQRGIACSTGSACASGSQEPSPVLLAMGCEGKIVNSSLRISLGSTTTPDEVTEAAAVLIEIVAKMSSF